MRFFYLLLLSLPFLIFNSCSKDDDIEDQIEIPTTDTIKPINLWEYKIDLPLDGQSRSDSLFRLVMVDDVILVMNNGNGSLHGLSTNGDLLWKNSNFGKNGLFDIFKAGDNYIVYNNHIETPGDYQTLNIQSGETFHKKIIDEIEGINFLWKYNISHHDKYMLLQGLVFDMEKNIHEFHIIDMANNQLVKKLEIQLDGTHKGKWGKIVVDDKNHKMYGWYNHEIEKFSYFGLIEIDMESYEYSHFQIERSEFELDLKYHPLILFDTTVYIPFGTEPYPLISHDIKNRKFNWWTFGSISDPFIKFVFEQPHILSFQSNHTVSNYEWVQTKMSAVSPETGRNKWNINNVIKIFDPVSVYRPDNLGILLQHSSSSVNIIIIDLKTGHKRGIIHANEVSGTESFLSSPLIDERNNRLYIIDDDLTLHAIEWPY